jgi:hypothetical protein
MILAVEKVVLERKATKVSMSLPLGVKGPKLLEHQPGVEKTKDVVQVPSFGSCVGQAQR